jgi:metal-sulfur cluster biosynthetic enzyme
MNEQTLVLEEKLKAALRKVYDPELGMNVIELGLVRKMSISPDAVEITMIMTTPFCPIGPQLLENARQEAQKATDLPVRVNMGMEMWDPGMMEDGAPKDWGLY